MDAEEVHDELEDLGREAFAERYGRFFLVLTDPDALESFSDFVNTASREANQIASGKHPLADADLRPLLPRNPKAPRITVGREGDVDVQLAHRSVSKLHAWFTIAGGLLSVTDARSKNGTWLNEAPLSPEKPRPVDVGDTLRFGTVAATIWGLDDLIAAVERR